ncbi:hypothetical protein AX14_010804, partial [Amanita brunnescens Koide BX004]
MLPESCPHPFVLTLAKGSLVIDLHAEVPEDIAMAYYEATDEEARDAVAVVSGLRQSGAVPTPSSGRVPPLSLPPFQPPAVVLPDQTSIPPSPALSHLQIPAMPPPPLPLFNPSPTSASLPPSSHTSSPAFAD